MTQVWRRAAELADTGAPFVVATVVWRRGPSSGRTGAHAIVHPDGTTEGWIGGACAHPTVVREALASLADGRPRLLSLGRPGDGRQDVVPVAMACESEGAMDVYLEPHVPSPMVVAVGGSPVVDTLARLARAVGWEAMVVDEGASEGAHPGVEEVRTVLDLSDVDQRAFVVVATQGHYDERALEAALTTPARYVGLVASGKRAGAVLEHLRGRGVPDEALTRVHAPAGLDLGSLEPEEMAVAILADLVARKASHGPGVEVRVPEQAIDPVCGMSVDPGTAHHSSEHAGVTYWFCAAGCQRAFEADPAAFLP